MFESNQLQCWASLSFFGKVCSDLLPIFFFYYWIWRVIFVFQIEVFYEMSLIHTFSLSKNCLFIPLHISNSRVLILMKSNLSIFRKWKIIGVLPKKLQLNLKFVKIGTVWSLQEFRLWSLELILHMIWITDKSYFSFKPIAYCFWTILF